MTDRSADARAAPLEVRFARVEAVLGGGVWLVLAWIGPVAGAGMLGRVHHLLLLGILVVVPLLLAQAVVSEERGLSARAVRAAVLGHPLAAAGVVASLFLPVGGVAAALACPWLLFTGLVALSGAGRLLARRGGPAEEVAIDVGCVYLPVGAVWLLASRAGIAPLGFGDPIAILTAVHFHFAGFAAPLLTGLVGRALRSRGGRGRVFPAIAGGVVSGMPLVAAGITASPHVEIVGVAVFGVSLVALAGLLLLRVAPSATGIAARGLLGVSALALLAGVALAALYGAGEFAGSERISIPRMVVTHGWLMGFGFVLLGALGFTLEGRARGASL